MQNPVGPRQRVHYKNYLYAISLKKKYQGFFLIIKKECIQYSYKK